LSSYESATGHRGDGQQLSPCHIGADNRQAFPVCRHFHTPLPSVGGLNAPHDAKFIARIRCD